MTQSATDPAELERLRPTWQALDRNNDGEVRLAELGSALAEMLARSDRDEDGRLSLEEYVSFDHDPGGSSQLPLADNVRLVADLPYAESTNPRQRLDIYLPVKSAVDGPLPVIAYLHGGAWRTGSKVMARSQVMALVQSGRYAAVSIGYRLAWEAAWPAQSHDTRAAIRWVRANAAEWGLDPNRICAMGASAGGHLAALLGVEQGQDLEGNLGRHTAQTGTVQCVIDFFGPADLTTPLLGDTGRDSNNSAVALLLGGGEDVELARAASPLHRIGPNAPPFLIVHGTADAAVAYSDSIRLAEALAQMGVPVWLQTVEGGGHGTFGAAREAVNARVEAFLNKMFHDPSTVIGSGGLTIEGR